MYFIFYALCFVYRDNSPIENMSLKLKMSLQDCINSTLHSIPAEIDYNGEANVARYFNVKATNSDEPG